MDALHVCPTEDAVREFLDHLLDPLLPVRPSVHDEPSPSLQQSVAKQVHSAVLLYNYYHRKQNPQLKFLDLESFCKLAVVLKPALLAHMKHFQKSHDFKLEDLGALPIVERMIMNACNLSDILDASRDAPSTEGWPIAKVSVLLINAQREKCFLKFSSITQGIWSAVEIDVDASRHNSGNPMTGKQTYKRKRISRNSLQDNSGTDEAILLQLAFSAVKEEADIDEADLKVLERHLVYSHSKEKTVTRFYILQCTKLTDDENKISFPIKELIKRLQGPLLEKSSDKWMNSSVVEHFHLLPYAEILSDWFSRDYSNNLHDVAEGMVIDITDATVAEVTVIDNTDATVRKGNFSKPGDNENISESHLNGNSVLDIVLKTESDCSESTQLTNNNACRAIIPQDFSLCPQYMDSHQVVHHQKDDEDKILFKTDQMENHQRAKTSWTDEGPICTNGFDLQFKGEELVTIQCNDEPGEGTTAIVNNIFDNVSAGINPVTARDHAFVTHHSNSEDEFRVGTVCAEKKKGNDVAGNDSNRSTNDPRVVTHLPSSLDLEKLLLTVSSKHKELSETALRAHLRKREKLSMQLRSIEDEIALCDSNIQRILKGGKDDLALKLEAIIEGCNDVCLNCSPRVNAYQCLDAQTLPLYHTKRRLSEAILKTQDPCQELDAICHVNNWILPTYHVMASDGSFQASVTLKEVDFECSTVGDLKPTPREGRGSAASKLLSKLRIMSSASQ